jgi:Major Facilitator Superfamily
LFVWRYLPEPPRHHQPGVRPPRMKYTDPRILPFVIVGVMMFTGMALVQQTMGFRFQDILGLSGRETAQQFGFAMMLSAACSLIAQFAIVQRISVSPFTLLRLAMPLLIVAFTIMALANTQMMLSIAMMILGFGMGMAGPGFMAVARGIATGTRFGRRRSRLVRTARFHTRPAAGRSALSDQQRTALRSRCRDVPGLVRGNAMDRQARCSSRRGLRSRS